MPANTEPTRSPDEDVVRENNDGCNIYALAGEETDNGILDTASVEAVQPNPCCIVFFTRSVPVSSMQPLLESTSIGKGSWKGASVLRTR
jgi:hypothetical protein